MAFKTTVALALLVPTLVHGQITTTHYVPITTEAVTEYAPVTSVVSSSSSTGAGLVNVADELAALPTLAAGVVAAVPSVATSVVSSVLSDLDFGVGALAPSAVSGLVEGTSTIYVIASDTEETVTSEAAGTSTVFVVATGTSSSCSTGILDSVSMTGTATTTDGSTVYVYPTGPTLTTITDFATVSGSLVETEIVEGITYTTAYDGSVATEYIAETTATSYVPLSYYSVNITGPPPSGFAAETVTVGTTTVYGGAAEGPVATVYAPAAQVNAPPGAIPHYVQHVEVTVYIPTNTSTMAPSTNTSIALNTNPALGTASSSLPKYANATVTSSMPTGTSTVATSTPYQVDPAANTTSSMPVSVQTVTSTKFVTWSYPVPVSKGWGKASSSFTTVTSTSCNTFTFTAPPSTSWMYPTPTWTTSVRQPEVFGDEPQGGKGDW